MTTAELITRVTDLLAYDLDSYIGASPTDATVVSVLNQRLRQMSIDIYMFDPKVTFTISTGVSAYDMRDTAIFSRKLVKPFDVVINGNMLRTCRGTRYGVWSQQEVDRLAPTWRTDGVGVPNKAWIAPPNTLYLHPTPSSSVVDSAACYVSGQVMAADLSSLTPTVEPEIPEELHDQLAILTACDVAKPYATEPSQITRIQAMEQMAMQAIDEVSRQNMRITKSIGTWSGRNDYIRM